MSTNSSSARKYGAAMRDGDLRTHELLQPLPAPWKEERAALGLGSRGPCSLTELMGACAPVSSTRKPHETSVYAKILPDNPVAYSSGELFLWTTAPLARRIRPSISPLPNPGPPKSAARPVSTVQLSATAAESPRDTLLLPVPHIINHWTEPRMQAPCASSSYAPTRQAPLLDIRGPASSIVEPHLQSLQAAQAQSASRVTQQAPLSNVHASARNALASFDAANVGYSATLPSQRVDSRSIVADSIGPIAVARPAEPASPQIPSAEGHALAVSSSPQIGQCRETISPVIPLARPSKVAEKRQDIDRVAFSALLQHCSSGSSEDALEAVARLKELARGEAGLARVCTLAKEWLADCHTDFVRRVRAEGALLLEAELYVRWLAECQSRVTVMYGLIQAHASGMRDPVKGMGRVAFGVASALFHFRREGGLFEVSWESMVRFATAADEAAIASAAARIRDILVRFDEILRAVVMRYKSEQSAGIGATMRACEKRLSAALAKMALQAGVNEHGEYASWMRTSRQVLLQWAESATKKVT